MESAAIEHHHTHSVREGEYSITMHHTHTAIYSCSVKDDHHTHCYAHTHTTMFVCLEVRDEEEEKEQQERRRRLGLPLEDKPLNPRTLHTTHYIAHYAMRCYAKRYTARYIRPTLCYTTLH